MARVRRIRSASMRGKEYRIRWKRPPPVMTPDGRPQLVDGMCQAPLSKNPEIWIAPDLPTIRMMWALLHESGHACMWDIDEEAVDETAESQTALLIRAGFTLV